MSKPQASIRQQKLKGSKTRSADEHNKRLIEVKHRNPNGEFSRIFGTEKSISQAVNERKADGYKIRKDGVEAIEIVASASPIFFRENEEDYGVYDEEKMTQWKDATVDFLKEKYGKNLHSVDLHLDEATPHIHAIVIPTFDRIKNKRRTNEQIKNDLPGEEYVSKIFDAKSISMKTDLIELQDSYAESLNHLGIERGVRKSRATHQEVKEFYSKSKEREKRLLKNESILTRKEKAFDKKSAEFEQQQTKLNAVRSSLVLERNSFEKDKSKYLAVEIEKGVENGLDEAAHKMLKQEKIDRATRHTQKLRTKSLDR